MVFKICMLLMLCFSCSVGSVAKTYYVSVSSGSDNASGQEPRKVTSDNKSGPFKTIRKALSTVKSGDEILILAGNYYEHIVIENINNIKIAPYGDGTVNLYGNRQELMNSRNKWKFVEKQHNAKFNNQQSVYVFKFPENSRMLKLANRPDLVHVFTASKKRLMTYVNQEDFNKRSIANSAGEGTFFKNNTLYLAVNNFADADFDKLFVTTGKAIINVKNSKNIVIDGKANKDIKFTFGVFGVKGVKDISGLKVRNCKFSYCKNGIYIYEGTGSEVTIERNEITYKLHSKWNWHNLKNTPLSNTAISYMDGNLRKVNIRHNFISQAFNGILVLPGNAEIAHNRLENIKDDAIELEGPAENIVVHHNFVKNAFMALSLVPVEKGPVYIYENVFYSNVRDYSYEIKNGQETRRKPKLLKFWNMTGGTVLKDGHKMKVSGNCHLYFNTFISNDLPVQLGVANKKHFSPVNSTFYNNIFFSNGNLMQGGGWVDDDIDFDSNVFYSLRKQKDKLFQAFNGVKTSADGINNNSWKGNVIKKLDFGKVNNKVNAVDFTLCKSSARRLKSGFNIKYLPAKFPNSTSLNKRKLPGASGS